MHAKGVFQMVRGKDGGGSDMLVMRGQPSLVRKANWAAFPRPCPRPRPEQARGGRPALGGALAPRRTGAPRQPRAAARLCSLLARALPRATFQDAAFLRGVFGDLEEHASSRPRPPAGPSNFSICAKTPTCPSDQPQKNRVWVHHFFLDNGHCLRWLKFWLCFGSKVKPFDFPKMVGCWLASLSKVPRKKNTRLEKYFRGRSAVARAGRHLGEEERSGGVVGDARVLVSAEKLS
jgi:hypothetical protein